MNKSITITLRIEPELYKVLKKQSGKTKKSVSKLIRQILYYWAYRFKSQTPEIFGTYNYTKRLIEINEEIEEEGEYNIQEFINQALREKMGEELANEFLREIKDK